MQLQRQLRVVDPVMDIETSLKIAFATTDMQQVNQHFGSAKSFAIYAVNMDQFTLLEVAQFGALAQDGTNLTGLNLDAEEAPAGGQPRMAGINHDKLAVKMASLKGCAAVYSQAMGSSAVQQLLRLNIQPIRVDAGSKIAELIETLQENMRSAPSGWLAKALAANGKPDTNRFDQMEDEGWEEE